MKIIFCIATACLFLFSCKKSGDATPGSGGSGGGSSPYVLDAFVKGTANCGMVVAAVQPDGKIVAAGACGFYRYTTDGAIDPSFTPPGELQQGNAILIQVITLQPDGKILLAGRFQTGQLKFLARLNADGSADASFHPYSGIGGYGSEINPSIGTFYVQTDGKIVIAGRFIFGGGTPYAAFDLMRLNGDGSWDTTYHPNINVTAGGVTCFVPTSDGKFLAGGSFAVQRGNTWRDYLAKFDANGNFDSSIDFSNTPTNTLKQGIANILQMPDGKLMVSGDELYMINGGTTLTDNLLCRLTPTGTFDPAFRVDDTTFVSLPVLLNLGNGTFLAGKYPNANFPATYGYLKLMDENGVVKPDIHLALDNAGITQMIAESGNRILLVGEFRIGSQLYGMLHIKKQ